MTHMCERRSACLMPNGSRRSYQPIRVPSGKNVGSFIHGLYYGILRSDTCVLTRPRLVGSLPKQRIAVKANDNVVRETMNLCLRMQAGFLPATGAKRSRVFRGSFFLVLEI